MDERKELRELAKSILDGLNRLHNNTTAVDKISHNYSKFQAEVILGRLAKHYLKGKRRYKLEQINEEGIAAVQHEIWSHWMKYMFSQCDAGLFGKAEIPQEKVRRWKRQMNTPYSELTEKEKESDRDQAHKVIKVLK